MNNIILYDGECEFCNKSIQFILKRDPEMHFHFAHLSSDIGQKLIKKLDIPKNMDSLILIKSNQYFVESTAALYITKQLYKGWPLLFILIIVPRFIRNFFYRLIANNRYTFFGKAKACEIPSPKDRKRFLQ